MCEILTAALNGCVAGVPAHAEKTSTGQFRRFAAG